MAHGFVSYSQANPTMNVGAYIAGKVKNAYGMAAEERKAREEEIKELEKKQQEGTITAQEVNRLNELEEQKKSRTTGRKRDKIKNSFFTKALASEFGGDRKRRLQGTFSKDPRKSQDPSLTKEERFSALLDENARPGEEPVAPEQPTDDIDPMDYGDANAQASTPQQSTLDKLISKVSASYDMIASKVAALKSEENKSNKTTEETNSRLGKFAGVFEAIKSYFDKDNELKKVEGDIEKQKVDNFRESQSDAKVQSEEASTDKVDDLSNFEDSFKDEEDEKKKENSLLDTVMKSVGNLFKRPGSQRPGSNIKPQTKAYSSPIGPQPMNSSTPWAAKGPGDRGGMFGGGGFTPRMPAQKLSAGGIVPGKPDGKPMKLAGGASIVDNPTTGVLPPGSSVIPLNRNNALGDMFQQAGQGADKSITDPMSKVMQLPTQVGGGLLLGLLSKVMSSMGGLSSLLKPALNPIINNLVPAFGLPTTITASMFGGEGAEAGGFNWKSFLSGGSSDSSGSSSSSSSSPSSTTPSSGGTVSSAPTGKETGIMSLRGGAGSPKELSQGGTLGDTYLHHNRTDERAGLKVRDYFIGSGGGPGDGSDGLGANLYTPLGFGPLKYKKYDQFGITFEDPQTGQDVGHYYHVDNAQHQLNGQVIAPGTFVGTQGGLPGTPSGNAGSSSAVHLHVEGTEAFHNAVINTYAGGRLLQNASGVHQATPQAPPASTQPAGTRQLSTQPGNTPTTPAAAPATASNKGADLLLALTQGKGLQSQESSPVATPTMAFTLRNPTPGLPGLYNPLFP